MIGSSGRIVMISGASRGIGRAIALSLHAKGYTISAGARDVKALKHSLLAIKGIACGVLLMRLRIERPTPTG